MKKYNVFELRFLQVLVPKKRMMEIYSDQVHINIEHVIWKRTSIDYQIPMIELDLSQNQRDFLDTFNSMTKSLKKIQDQVEIEIRELFKPKEDKDELQKAK